MTACLLNIVWYCDETTITHTVFLKVGQAGAQPRGRAFGAFAIPEIFKTLHSNFDICRNFQRIKMKFYILIIFKKSY